MDVFHRLAVMLKELDAAVVHLIVFGSLKAYPAAEEAMRRIFGKVDWPVSWVEGAACDGNPVAGLQVFAFSGGEVKRACFGGHVVGSVFEDGAFRHCVLGGLGPGEKSASQNEQTTRTLENLSQVLTQNGFSLKDVVRTWFFLDDILGWYEGFNHARTEIYSGVKFQAGSLPASTGVGGRNPAGAALAAGAWAAKSLTSAARIEEVVSPLQCPASAYGSSFSRAMEISSPAGRRLLVSGTASIAEDGRTLWKGDAQRQVLQTMQVVENILHSRGFGIADLSRATAYFKRSADVSAFWNWCAAHESFSLPAILTNCQICRDDLLFEFEADAWRPAL